MLIMTVESIDERKSTHVVEEYIVGPLEMITRRYCKCFATIVTLENI